MRPEADLGELPLIPRARVTVFLFLAQAGVSLSRHLLRSVLAALGIAAGVAAVAWCVALGQSASAETEARFAALGDNLVWIEAGSRNVNGVRTGSHGENTLTQGDVDAIRRDLPLIARVSPNVDGTVQVQFGNQNWSTHYRGVGPDFFEIKSWPIAEGAPMTDEEVNEAVPVCWIGQTVEREIFAGASPLGQFLRVEGFPCKVVGVLSKKGQTGGGHDQDDIIILPYTTADSRIRGRGFTWYDDILCSAVSPEAVPRAIDSVVSLLRQRHQLAPGHDDFNIRRPDEVLQARTRASRTMELLLVVLASIALVVGGIGVMNVMLASVSQRTREIGLRLAVGATPGAVRLQFLGESVVLSAVGGMAGLALSAAGAPLFEQAIGWEISMPFSAALAAMAVSAGVGVVFGYLPARRAARLDPITALRHE